jgi:NAD(P)-dependent dehydrogenase (short-subunit alcohol dehydrogenase family)
LVEEGAHVFIVGRRQAELDKASQLLGRNVTTVQADIAELGDLDRLYRTVREKKGGIDVLVANAAYVEIRTLAESTPEHFDKTFGVNARGTFFTVQKALPLLHTGASIVLVGSAVHSLGMPMYTT